MGICKIGKKTFWYLILLLVLFLNGHCSSGTAVKDKEKISLSVKITNPVSGFIEISDSENIVYVSTMDSKETTTVEFDPISEFATYTIEYNDESLNVFAREGADIAIKSDANNFVKNVKLNDKKYSYVDYKEKKSNIANSFWQNPPKIYALPISDYKTRIDSLNNVYQELFQEYQSTTKSDWIAVEAATLKYNYLESFMIYPIYFKLNTGKDANLGSDFYDYEKEIEFNNPLLLASEKYKTFLLDYFRIKAREKMKVETRLETSSDFKFLLEEQLALMDEWIENSEVKTFFVFKSIADHIKRFGGEDIANIYKGFLKNKEVKDIYKAKITDLFESSKLLMTGKPAPDFELESLDGDKVQFRDLIGKSMYIDIWATWCIPCLKEAGPFEELSTQFENIQFISISMDTDKDSWIKKVKKTDSNTVKHFNAVGAFESDFSKIYKVQALPRFILIDKTGNIVDANALKPSSKRISNLLRRLN